MPLTLHLRTVSSVPLEVDSVQMETVRQQSADQVAQTLIYRGNKQVPLGEFFDVTGSAAEDATLIWQGDCTKVKLIGSKLTHGTVRVEGNAGMHLGSEMSGGEIIVEGSASDWVGAEMKGGRITVTGDAGHLVGAVYRGGRKGMKGGEIYIHGSAGNEVGHTMRRGLIAVGGAIGDFAGVGMIAGSIFVFGRAGIRPGAGMKRGTIGLFAADSAPEMLPTFRYACTYRPPFLPLYGRYLLAAGLTAAERCLEITVDRYCGDLLELGKGEILTPAT